MSDAILPEQTEGIGAQEAETLEALCRVVLKHHPDGDVEVVRKAYQFSFKAHQGQRRTSGEPYIYHPLQVAHILAELRLDSTTVATGLLHDTVEDTVATPEQITKEFGPEIAGLVDGLTKISKITFQTSEEKQAENFRKMILAMAKDIRVILVKLVDRLHNMRTLQHLKPEKQARIAQETLDIYAPLANRLGLSSVKRELEDLGLRYTKPEIYYKLVTQVAKKMKEREKYTADVQALIQAALRDHGYTNAAVTGRPKHFYSIHQKMERRSLTFEQMYDITGFRIVVDSVEQCYGALGLIHSLWTPVPGRFKDYIAIPKANLYQSLHTTVIGPGGERIEIQIRTHEMHDTAERGIAAHWAYKERGGSAAPDQERFSWLNRLLEWNKEVSDNTEFLETVKLDLFSEDVYVFTPKGRVMEFPQGATPLDFAYAVHTDLGTHCIGAKVNSRMVPLKYKLKSGDSIEVLTSVNQTPNKDWLKIVKTSRAKNKIRAYIKAMEHERSKISGQNILEKDFRRDSVNLNSMLKDGSLQKIAESFSLKTVDDLFSSVGYGKISAKKILTRVVHKESTEPLPKKQPMERIAEEAAKKSKEKHSVKVRGVDDLLVRFARCCSPVPGDNVIGFITRGRGISVHAKACPKVLGTDPNRLVDIDWDLSAKAERKVQIRIVCADRPGLLGEMSEAIGAHDVNITNARIGTTKDRRAVCLFSITIADLTQLKTILSKLNAIPGVVSAERVQKKD